MGINVKAEYINSDTIKFEVTAMTKLELIHKLTSGFMAWNDCKHDEYNTGYMNCLIDTVHILSEGENQDEKIHR